MRSALYLSGQARGARFVPGRAGRAAQIITLIFMLWQPSVSAMPYIRGVDLRGAHGWRVNRAMVAGPACQVKLGWGWRLVSRIREIGPNAPISRIVSIGQSEAINFVTQSHRIELVGIGSQRNFGVAQTFAPRQ